MKVILESKLNPGDKAVWTSPYGAETVEITNVVFDDRKGQFEYHVKEYSFVLSEWELHVVTVTKEGDKH